MAAQQNTYSFGDGSTEPLYLTSGACEPTHSYIEDLLSDLGIPAGKFDGSFYPLTDEEAKYIGEDLADVADGFGALMGYSALYQGQKYLMPSIEVYFGDDVPTTADEARAYAEALKAEYSERLEAVGGHVLLVEGDAPDRHLVQVLVPFEYAIAHASSYQEWRQHLEQVLLATDLKLAKQANAEQSL